MRWIILCLVAALFAGTLLVPSPSRSDEKEDKKREEDEKELAKIEAMEEKAEWAIKSKQEIEELAKWLKEAGKIEVYRLDPTRKDEKELEGKRSFHGYQILTEGTPDKDALRTELASFVTSTFHWSWFRLKGCFEPRHGIRAVNGKRTLDYLICFRCNRVKIFEGAESIHALPLGSPKENPIEKYLLEVEKSRKQP